MSETASHPRPVGGAVAAAPSGQGAVVVAVSLGVVDAGVGVGGGAVTVWVTVVGGVALALATLTLMSVPALTTAPSRATSSTVPGVLSDSTSSRTGFTPASLRVDAAMAQSRPTSPSGT